MKRRVLVGPERRLSHLMLRMGTAWGHLDSLDGPEAVACAAARSSGDERRQLLRQLRVRIQRWAEAVDTIRDYLDEADRIAARLLEAA